MPFAYISGAVAFIPEHVRNVRTDGCMGAVLGIRILTAITYEVLDYIRDCLAQCVGIPGEFLGGDQTTSSMCVKFYDRQHISYVGFQTAVFDMAIMEEIGEHLFLNEQVVAFLLPIAAIDDFRLPLEEGDSFNLG